MINVISAAEMRAIDGLTTDRYALPSILLMETASHGAARHLTELLGGNLSGKTARIFCGPGNNGGDGAALARHLILGGARVELLFCGRFEKLRGDAAVNFQVLRRLHDEAVFPSLQFCELRDESEFDHTLQALSDVEVIVDALFGTGLTRPLEGLYLRAVRHLNEVRAERERRGRTSPLLLSLDLPSGLDADRADAPGEAVRADLTVTFTAPKAANVLPPAADYNGRLEIIRIGSPPGLVAETASQLYLLEPEDARRWLVRTRYTSSSYKNSHGHALVLAGSRNFTGAAVLSANAAMRSGAGLVTLAAPSTSLASMTPRLLPEIMTLPLSETSDGAVDEAAAGQVAEFAARASVIALGPGLSAAAQETRQFVRLVVESRACPMVLDADGLNALAPWPVSLKGTAEAPLVLTPHLGEMRRLLGLASDAPVEDRVAVARAFARDHEVVLVLKGARILIATPEGKVFLNPTGNPGAGTAGAGDTLTGIVAGFLAQEYGLSQDAGGVIEAVLAAIFLSGMACDAAMRAKGMRSLVASDIREHLHEAIRALDAPGEII